MRLPRKPDWGFCQAAGQVEIGETIKLILVAGVDCSAKFWIRRINHGEVNEGKPANAITKRRSPGWKRLCSVWRPGNYPWRRALALFEEGIGLAKHCTGKLDAAEGRLEVLLGFEGGEPKIDAFMPGRRRV